MVRHDVDPDEADDEDGEEDVWRPRAGADKAKDELAAGGFSEARDPNDPDADDDSDEDDDDEESTPRTGAVDGEPADDLEEEEE